MKRILFLTILAEPLLPPKATACIAVQGSEYGVGFKSSAIAPISEGKH